MSFCSFAVYIFVIFGAELSPWLEIKKMEIAPIKSRGVLGPQNSCPECLIYITHTLYYILLKRCPTERCMKTGHILGDLTIQLIVFADHYSYFGRNEVDLISLAGFSREAADSTGYFACGPL